jgi:hypothetical protein
MLPIFFPEIFSPSHLLIGKAYGDRSAHWAFPERRRRSSLATWKTTNAEGFLKRRLEIGYTPECSRKEPKNQD